MERQTRSILEELHQVAVRQDTVHLIELTGNNIIQSAINFIDRLHQIYDEDVANDLEKRFLNSIKSADSRKFNRGVNTHLKQ